MKCLKKKISRLELLLVLFALYAVLNILYNKSKEDVFDYPPGDYPDYTGRGHEKSAIKNSAEYED